MPIICGGDWNLVLENIDKKGGPLLSHKKNRENKTFYRKKWQLIFGECLTLQRNDTHGDKNHQPYTANLIFFIISVGLSNITRKTYISYGFKSDQSFLSLEIDKQQLKKGKVVFFINLTHLFCLKYQLTNCYSMIQQQNKLTRRTFND